MNYYFKDNSLYFHCATADKKMDLIRANNKVCFEIEQSHEIIKNDDSCKWSTKFRCTKKYCGLGRLQNGMGFI